MSNSTSSFYNSNLYLKNQINKNLFEEYKNYCKKCFDDYMYKKIFNKN